MEIAGQILSIIIAYFIGSIPSAVWIGRAFYGVDVREYGSGNAGATNTLRVLGKKAALPVLFIDILKGFGAVFVAYFTDLIPGTVPFINMQLVLGVAALLGHIFPALAGFRGGKGIATLLGVMLAVHPYAAVVAIVIFLIVYLMSSYVSLGSIIAALTFPMVLIFVFDTKTPSLIIFSMIIAVLVLITHQKNIERLLRREESKSKLIKKKQL